MHGVLLLNVLVWMVMPHQASQLSSSTVTRSCSLLCRRLADDEDQIEEINYSIDSWTMLAGQAIDGMGRTLIEREEMLPVRTHAHSLRNANPTPIS